MQAYKMTHLTRKVHPSFTDKVPIIHGQTKTSNIISAGTSIIFFQYITQKQWEVIQTAKSHTN